MGVTLRNSPIPVPKPIADIRTTTLPAWETDRNAMRMERVGGIGPVGPIEMPDSRPPIATSAPAMLANATDAFPEDFTAHSDRVLMDFDAVGGPAETIHGHYIARMAEVGRMEGFRVVTGVAGDRGADALARATGDAANVDVIPRDGYDWPEDSMHFSNDGSATVPPVVPIDRNGTAVLLGRLERLTGEPVSPEDIPALAKAHPEVLFNMSGQVALSDGGAATAGVLEAMGIDARIGDTYVEGGNIINGTKDGVPYAVVGADALSRNRALLGADETEVRARMAADLGVAPKNLHFIEQPGDFHVDMAVTPWGNGRMLVNDARLAADAQIRASGMDPASEEATRLSAAAERRGVMEDRTAADLEAAGFDVVRVPGRYFEIDEKGVASELANFLNGEAGLNANGERYFVTQRGPQGFEDEFLSTLPQDLPVRLYFAFGADPARAMLSLNGGASCLIKRVPDGWRPPAR